MSKMLLSGNSFRSLSNIYDGVFFAKTVNGYEPLTIYPKKASSKMSERVLNMPH